MAIKGSCHCGATRFEVDIAPESVTQCTCTDCSKRGALWAYYAPEQVKIDSRSNAVYLWQSKTVAHHYCPACGNSTYNESPTWIEGKPHFDKPRVSINARLLDDFDLGAVPVTVIDGRNLW